jgi:hypothetical protein
MLLSSEGGGGRFPLLVSSVIPPGIGGYCSSSSSFAGGGNHGFSLGKTQPLGFGIMHWGCFCALANSCSSSNFASSACLSFYRVQFAFLPASGGSRQFCFAFSISMTI